MSNIESLTSSSPITDVISLSENKYLAKFADTEIDGEYIFSINPLSNQITLEFIKVSSAIYQRKGLAQLLLTDLLLRAKRAGYYEVILYTQNTAMHLVIQKALKDYLGHITYIDDEGIQKPYNSNVHGQVDIIIDIREMGQYELTKLLETKMATSHSLLHSQQ